MTPKGFRAPLWLRIISLGLAILLIFWLPIEDLSIRWVTLFSAAICTLVAVRMILARPSSGGKQILYLSIAGTLAGLAVTPVTLVLMAFKTGLHGHPVPDFSPGQVSAAIQRTPFWIIGGMLIGLGTGLFNLAHVEKPEEHLME